MNALEVDFADVFAGRPDELEARARRLQEAAGAIDQAAAALRELVDAQRGLAADAAAASADEAAEGLRRAHIRYAGTASALVAFAVELSPIQARARAAVADAEDHQGRVYLLEADVHDLQSDLTIATAAGDPTSALEDELWRARESLASSRGAIEEARRTLHDAREQIREAAGRAGEQIKTAAEEGADSFADNWTQFWAAVGDALAVAGEWAEQVLGQVVDGLSALLSALVSVLVVALLLVVAVLIGGFIISVIGPAGLLAAGAAAGAILIAMAVAETVAAPRLVATPSVPEGDDFELRGYGDVFAQIGEQDVVAGRTQIRVVAIRDGSGAVTAWRVQLPSTQEWSPTNTDGGLNDVRTDLMLAMFPEIETQYEQAVWQAMEDAGVFEGDAPVMLAGWSLGGMVAGEMATDPRLEGRVQAVLTAGSPIDKHYGGIPDGVRVTQINNGFDPVHTLEMIGLEVSDYLRSGTDWQTHRPLTWPVHEARMYGAEADRFLPQPRAGDEIFFAAPGDASREEVYAVEYVRGS